jgi:hypothetical protein
MRGRKMSAAERAKLSARMKGRKLSAAWRAAISAGMRGKKHPHKGWHGHRHVKLRGHHQPRTAHRHTPRQGPAYHARKLRSGGRIGGRADAAARLRRRRR